MLLGCTATWYEAQMKTCITIERIERHVVYPRESKGRQAYRSISKYTSLLMSFVLPFAEFEIYCLFPI